MMVVTFLRQADFRLETKNLFAVFAHLAIHVAGPFLNLDHSIDESLQDQRLRIEVRGLDELDLGMPCRNGVGVVVDALHEHAGEKEIGEDDDPFEAEFRRMLEARFDQGECDTRIADFSQPAECFKTKRITFEMLEFASS